MPKVGAILLAAGLSRRMGTRNKLLLPVAERPMIAHVARVYLTAVDGAVCVVTGHEAEQVRAALSGLPLQIVHNPDFVQGQAFSVRAGLLAAPEAETLLIGLGDQPDVTATDLQDLLAAHTAADPAKLSVPHNGVQRGNPIAVPRAMRAQLLRDKTNPGCGRFSRSHPEQVQQLRLPNPGFYKDIDTPAEFAAFSSASNPKEPA